MKEKLRKLLPITDKAEFAVQILFLLYLCLGFNNLTFGTVWISVVMWPTYLLGAALLAVRALRFRNYTHTPGLLALLALCAVCAVSILLNREYGIKKNLIYLILWVFYFFLYYTSGKDVPTQTLEKRFRILAHIFCGVVALLTAISLCMMAAGLRETVTVNGTELYRGFVYGRLYGAYLTPNAGAVAGAVASLLAAYFIRRYRSKIYSAAAVLSMILHFVYLVFSDSRSGRVSLAVGAGIYVLFRVLTSEKPTKAAARAACSAVVAVAAAVCLFFAPKGAQNGYNAAVTAIAKKQAEELQEAGEDAPEKTPNMMLIERGYDLSGDISNRRFAIWESGVEIWKTCPLFGATFAGFLPYAKDHVPDTYIINNDYMEMETLDSDPVNLLVSDGALGVLCFAVFVVWFLYVLFRYTLFNREKSAQNVILLSVCAAAASASLFFSGVLFLLSPYSLLFWAALGLLARYGTDRKQEVRICRK